MAVSDGHAREKDTSSSMEFLVFSTRIENSATVAGVLHEARCDKRPFRLRVAAHVVPGSARLPDS
jgi:hypothetical protein